jgi:hypothetical protein
MDIGLAAKLKALAKPKANNELSALVNLVPMATPSDQRFSDFILFIAENHKQQEVRLSEYVI